MQCTCTSLIFLCLTPDSMSPLLRPTSSDVDGIVHEGTELYQSVIASQFCGKPRYLLIDELPQNAVVRGNHYSVKRLEVATGLIGTSVTNCNLLTFSLEDAFQKAFDSSSACFLTLGSAHAGYTTAVRKFDTDHYWSFDSHSRNTEGTFTTAGKAVIMEMLNLTELVTFIRKLASSLTIKVGEMPFEIVPVDCSSTVHCETEYDYCHSQFTEVRSGSSPTIPIKHESQHFRQTSRTIRYIYSTKKGQRARVICSVCVEFSDVVRQFYPKGPLPAICTSTGAEARSYTIDNHLKSEHHKQSLAAGKLKKLNPQQKMSTVPILKQISHQNEQLANKIGGLIISVYNDAKNLSLSAFSWPSRVIASHIANHYKCNEPFVAFQPSSFDLQYVSPACHRELLHTIVQAHVPDTRQYLSSVLALSFRCDASMDRTQKDNQFQLAKVVDHSGEERTLFVGLSEVVDAGAEGHLKALQAGANATVGFNTILRKMTHISTDGENKNVGEHRGLWKLIDNERRKLNLHEVPLLKSVCAVHSSALAYKDLCKGVSEISHLVTTVSGLASFFHTSARRTAQLRLVAEERSLAVRRFPTYFEVRWCEFTSSLIDSILCSWRALMAYFSTAKQNCKSSASDAARFQKTLTNLDNVKLMCFLADLLFILKNFQKRLQSDEICVTDLKPQLDAFTQKLLSMENSPLVGGWEETLSKEFTVSDGNTTLFDTLLWIKPRRRQSCNEYVTDKRDFAAVRHDSIHTLYNFMTSRLSFDEDFDRTVDSMSSFVSFTASDNDIRTVHQGVSPDVDLAQLAEEYKDMQFLQRTSKSSSKSTATARDVLTTLCKQNANVDQDDCEVSPLAVTLSRILVCKPQSADCERLISAYNRLKTDTRSSLDGKTINDYMYILLNMPPLAKYDQRPAVLYWLHDKQRRHKATPKAGQQEYFNSFFFDDTTDTMNEYSAADREKLVRKF